MSGLDELGRDQAAQAAGVLAAFRPGASGPSDLPRAYPDGTASWPS